MKQEDFNRILEESLDTKSSMAKAFEQAVKTMFITPTEAHILIVIGLCESIAKDYYKTLDLQTIAQETLSRKATEYAMNGDRLWNFKPNYSFMCKDPIDNIVGYIRKQAASCMDILTNKYKNPSKAMIQEKFGDVLNYCVLLIGLLKEDSEDYYDR